MIVSPNSAKIFIIFLHVCIIFSQLHAGGKDEVGVVLFGTPDTDNELAQDEQYSNITTAWQLTTPSLELLLYLRREVEPGTVSADCILISLASFLERVGI